MERAEQEVVVRRARRVVRAFRLAVLVGIVLILLPVLLGRQQADGTVFLDGRTSQGGTFTMRLDDGRPANLGTHFTASCRPRMDWHVRWWSFDGKTATFGLDDGLLRVRETLTREYEHGWVGDRTYTLEARVDDDRVRGTMRFVERIRHVDAPPYACDSGDVAFSARAGGTISLGQPGRNHAGRHQPAADDRTLHRG